MTFLVADIKSILQVNFAGFAQRMLQKVLPQNPSDIFSTTPFLQQMNEISMKIFLALLTSRGRSSLLYYYLEVFPLEEVQTRCQPR